MLNALKKLADGFFFGVGFSFAVALVFGVIGLCSAVYVFKRGASAVSEALSKTRPLENVDGVYLVSSNLTKQGDAVIVTALLTNSTDLRFQDLRVWANLNGKDGEQVDFNPESLDVFEAHSQTNLTVVYSNVARSNAIEDLSFEIEVLKEAEKK